MWLTPILHIEMWPTPKGFTRVHNLVPIAMWLTPKEYWGVIMFCLWEKFSQRVCHIQICKYFANFYVNNALHGVTLANCSHFQYVYRLKLRIIWISVKTCIDVTFYDEPFCHLHNWEIFPYSTKDNFGRCPVIYSWITIVPWYVSNISIIFDCSMLLYYLFWMFYGLYYVNRLVPKLI